MTYSKDDLGEKAMKKVGIVGGLGPASTLDYYMGIINGHRMRTRDDNYPEILINSVNMTEMLSYIQNKEWDAVADMVVAAIDDLANAGAEFAAIASNTPHIVFDAIQERSSLPLISIVEETCRCAESKGCRKAVVIGTRFTMGSGLYTKALGKYGIEAVVPSAADQEIIHGIIFPNLEDGIIVPEDKKKMIAIANRVIEEHSADALILGCTELPLMIKDGDLETMILNATRIHIDSIIDRI